MSSLVLKLFRKDEGSEITYRKSRNSETAFEENVKLIYY